MYQLLQVGTEHSIYSTYCGVKCVGMGLYALLFDADDMGGGTASDPPAGAKGGGDGAVDSPPAGRGGRGGVGGGDSGEEDDAAEVGVVPQHWHLSKRLTEDPPAPQAHALVTGVSVWAEVVQAGTVGGVELGWVLTWCRDAVEIYMMGNKDLEEQKTCASAKGRRAEDGGGVKERADDGVYLWR
ncbi:hypothetical protein B0H14DRAFT_2638614 [Mycena olivaceomarginata]|nr:hypothetical protein B0H14DRAFT_2638614 [Mycena olivaceomarginata]